MADGQHGELPDDGPINSEEGLRDPQRGGKFRQERDAESRRRRTAGSGQSIHDTSSSARQQFNEVSLKVNRFLARQPEKSPNLFRGEEVG